MKILIDARKLGHGGIGTYTANLIDGLRLYSSAQIVALGDRARIKTRWGDSIAIVESGTPLYSIQELWRLARVVNRSGCDLFHTPHYMLPFGLSIPSVATIHDIIHVTNPQRWYFPLVARALIGSTLRRADAVFTVSDSSRRALRAAFPSRKADDFISVVPNVLDSIFSQPLKPADFEHPREGAYFFAVLSNDKPHKGGDLLVAAYARARAACPSIPRLLIAGPGGVRWQGELGISVLGVVSREELRRLYCGALAVIVPSREEGFCIPVIEAHACGVPVIAGPVSAIRELATDHDVLIEALSEEALSAALIGARGLTPTERPALSAATIEAYSLRRFAAQILRRYSALLESVGERNCPSVGRAR